MKSFCKSTTIRARMRLRLMVTEAPGPARWRAHGHVYRRAFPTVGQLQKALLGAWTSLSAGRKLFLNDFNAVEAYPSKSHTAYPMPRCSWMFWIDPLLKAMGSRVDPHNGRRLAADNPVCRESLCRSHDVLPPAALDGAKQCVENAHVADRVLQREFQRLSSANRQREVVSLRRILIDGLEGLRYR